MLVALAAVFVLVSGAFGAFLRRREGRWRADLLSDCAGRLAAPRLGRDRAGFATLRGRYAGTAVDVRLVPDTLVHRRLPQLWLQVTLRTPLPTGCVLDVLRRPAGAEFYAPDHLPNRYPVPEAWPPDTPVRGTAGADSLHARLAPVLAQILMDPRVKEVLFTPDGLRLTLQASQGTWGTYLLLRGSRFPIERVSPELFDGILDAARRLLLALSETDPETRHARAA